MTYFEAVLIIILAFGIPGSASYVLAKWVGHESRRRFHEVGIAVFLQMGVIFAVIVAFVFTNVWSQFDGASNAVFREAADLQNMADRSAYLPPKAAVAVRMALTQYMKSEVDHEWPSMEHRKLSSDTIHAFTDLFGAVASIQPTNSLVSGTRESLLHLIRDVRDQRQLRLFQIAANVPQWLWTVLIGFCCILVLFVMAGSIGHDIIHAVLVGIFAAFLATILVTIHLFDYPFEGSIRIPPEAIANTIEHVNDIPIVVHIPQAIPSTSP